MTAGAVAAFTFDEIEEGREEHASYAITPAVYESFLSAFRDISPLHMDDEYARKRGFKAKVMHGAILNGFLSEFLGVRLPGRSCLLLSADLRYRNPSYLNDRLTLHATVQQKQESSQVVVFKMRFFNETQSSVAADGRVQIQLAAETDCASPQ